jgi:hypothetical protein
MMNKFQKIKIEAFVAKSLKSNPGLDRGPLTKSLEGFKNRKRKVRCVIVGSQWIIGSALVGKG